MADLDAARHAKDALLARLGPHPLVAGCGLARVADGYAVKLNLAAEWEGEDLPAEVEGVPVQVQVVGRISARRPPPQG